MTNCDGETLDLRQLRHLAAIVEYGSFVRAARVCNVSQPALSSSIAQLEARLGVALLERGAFGARATPVGLILYERAALILSEVRRANEEVIAIRDGEGGSVAIGVGPLFEHTIMPNVLADFIHRWPRINVTAVVGLTGELFARLAQGHLDLTISSPPGAILAPDGLHIEILQSTHDVVVASAKHPLWQHSKPSLAVLSNYRWIVSARVGEASRNFFENFAAAGLQPPKTIVQTDSIPMIRALVQEREFLCVVSPHFVGALGSEQRGGEQLKIVPCPEFASTRQICVATRSGGLATRAAREMAALIKRSCSEYLIVDDSAAGSNIRYP